MSLTFWRHAPTFFSFLNIWILALWQSFQIFIGLIFFGLISLVFADFFVKICSEISTQENTQVDLEQES